MKKLLTIVMAVTDLFRRRDRLKPALAQMEEQERREVHARQRAHHAIARHGCAKTMLRLLRSKIRPPGEFRSSLADIPDPEKNS